MRKLVSIRLVSELRPIPDADRIEMAVIDGWQLVTKKGEVQPGDHVVYFEIDSFLPIEERYEFLRKSSFARMDDNEGFRLRTIKLRGQISQGLAIPISQFPELAEFPVGTDVTERLGVTKFEKPIPANLAGSMKGGFPGFISKTDEERIQNLPEFFEMYRDEDFEVSVKLDGTSCTIYLYENEFGVCSRNNEWYETPESTQWRIARELELEERLRAFHDDTGRSLALQGEIIGPGIQGNNEKLAGLEFRLFNIFDIREHRYLSSEERESVLTVLSVGREPIPHVPVLGVSKVFQDYPTMDAMLAAADGPSLNPQRHREGIVCKSCNLPETVSFKVIANRYLLKNDG